MEKEAKIVSPRYVAQTDSAVATSVKTNSSNVAVLGRTAD